MPRTPGPCHCDLCRTQHVETLTDLRLARIAALEAALAKITERLDYIPKSDGWKSQFADSFNCDGGMWAGPGVLAALDIARRVLAGEES